MLIQINTSHINGSERQLGRVLEILRGPFWRLPAQSMLTCICNKCFSRHTAGVLEPVSIYRTIN